MSRKRIDPALRSLILRHKAKAKRLGIRGLADFLKQKHDLGVSKSAIHKVLKDSGIDIPKGRKSAIRLSSRQGVISCGLVLLNAIDYQIGLFDYLTFCLKQYFPKLQESLLKKMIILASFSHLIGEDILGSRKQAGFLRLIGLRSLPKEKFDYFKGQLAQNRPKVDLAPLKESLKSVLSLKFYFVNGTTSHCDAKMSSFWQESPKVGEFSLPLRAARLRIERMLAQKTLIIGYTKSFYYLSPITFNFLKGLESGLKTIEFLGKGQEVLDRIEVDSQVLAIAFGYSPQVISKKAVFLSHADRFKAFLSPGLGEFFIARSYSNITQPHVKEEVILANVLIKDKLIDPAYLGVLISPKQAKSRPILKKYLYFWPYMGEDFLKEMKTIEKSLSSSQEDSQIRLFLPKTLAFSEPADFVRAAQILSVAFKELIWGWEPKDKKGDFSLGNDHISVFLKQVPKEVKKSFNKASLYIAKKRVFIV